MTRFHVAVAVAVAMAAAPVAAADYLSPKQGGWIACDFKFHMQPLADLLQSTPPAAR
jgi:hypothetical protein